MPLEMIGGLLGIGGAGASDLAMLQGVFQQQEAFQTALMIMQTIHQEKQASLTAGEDAAKGIRS